MQVSGKQRIMGAVAGALLLAAVPWSAGSASAAPAMACEAGQFKQEDFAGYYVYTEQSSKPMILRIEPCGATFLSWKDARGDYNTAAYMSYKRDEDGGLFAKNYLPDETGGFLDGAALINIVAMEPGFIEVRTAGPVLGFQQYRLKKGVAPN